MSRFKIAVFVSGPIRFVDLVRQNLDLRLAGVDHDFFYHLWMQDLGNKVRHGYYTDPAALLAQPNTKALLFNQPYTSEFYAGRIGTQVNTHSSVNAVVGMYLGLSHLCDIFRSLPDRRDYTHILRMRTDCSILTSELVSQLHLDDEVVVLGKDHGLSSSWASDHFLCAPADDFLRLFSFDRIEEFYAVFEEGRRNPEKIMKHLLTTRLPAGRRIVDGPVRFQDYQIVYLPAREGEQPWVMDLLRKGDIELLFLEPERHARSAENDALLREGMEVAPKTDPYGSPMKIFLRTWKQRIKRWLGSNG